MILTDPSQMICSSCIWSQPKGTGLFCLQLNHLTRPNNCCDSGVFKFSHDGTYHAVTKKEALRLKRSLPW